MTIPNLTRLDAHRRLFALEYRPGRYVTFSARRRGGEVHVTFRLVGDRRILARP
jgi:hypothetical protein